MPTPTTKTTRKLFKNLKIVQINARSLRPRQTELSKLVVEKDVVVLVVLESWIKQDSKEGLPKLPGLTAAAWKHRNITYKNGHGGGVIVYVNSRRMSYAKVDLVSQPANGVDMCCVKLFPEGDLKSPHESIVICGVYAPPELTGSEWWKCVPTENCILCADVNCCGSWSSFGTPTTCGDNLDMWMVSRNMIVANEPLMATRVCPSSGSLSSPDLTAIPSNLVSSAVWLTGDDIGSDHLPIILTIKEIQVPARRETKWAFKKAKWGLFAMVLDRQLDKVVKSDKIDEAVDNLTKTIQQLSPQQYPEAAEEPNVSGGVMKLKPLSRRAGKHSKKCRDPPLPPKKCISQLAKKYQRLPGNVNAEHGGNTVTS